MIILLFLTSLSFGSGVVEMTTTRGAETIRRIELEEYLVGVLAGEIPASWPMEALKAQAVAARSYAQSKGLKMVNGWRDQVWRDPMKMDLQFRQRIQKAVRETQGMVLMKNQKFFTAWYHADCGGKTETSENVWGLMGAQTSVKDQGCPLHPKGNWTAVMQMAQLRQRFGLPDLKEILVAGRTLSGRAKNLILRGKSDVVITADEFRRKLGFSKLRSTLFQVTKMGGEMHFEGKGYGHGVGLCQWGAKYLAGKGQNFRQILAHYYPGTQIQGQ